MIHDLKAPIAAENFLDDVEETVHGLKDMPDRFELVKDETLRNAGYRKCSIKDYLLFYKVFEKKDRPHIPPNLWQKELAGAFINCPLHRRRQPGKVNHFSDKLLCDSYLQVRAWHTSISHKPAQVWKH